tara:strand:+ start:1579 stop:2064 length:486 start_codon:yes stop_codon:yes gene_type:complete
MEKLYGDDCFRALDLKDHVLFYFTANWCKPCQLVSPLMDNLTLEYQNKPIKMFKIDIDEDENLEISQKCEIKQVPAFLLFKDRNFIDKVLGGNIEKIKALIDNNLNVRLNTQKVEKVFNKNNLVKNQNVPEFIPSKTFQGAKIGYIFKTDTSGLGYYLDKK